jgi:hypothetical protein
MRDLGRLEGRVDAVERRIHSVEFHLKNIDDKLGQLFEALNKRLGQEETKRESTASFWIKLGLLIAFLEFVFRVLLAAFPLSN